MAYNLPTPWSPKYAYPANTRVEALQRGTFTTRQQPQGSYDDPAVGTAGYAIPGYVLDTPYGQGAMVTKWMPRGTVVGAVPHWVQQPNFAILAQTTASGEGTGYEIGPPIESVHADPFATYGTRVADQVIAGLNRLPAVHRKAAMKTLFDRIDPKLYMRVTATATKAARAGIPPKRALHHAIAVEARSGFLRELHSIGVSGHVSPGSQTGLGCWGCAAIGLGATMTLDKSAIAAVAAQTAQAPITVNRVHNADGTYTEYCTQGGKVVPCPNGGQLATTVNSGIATGVVATPTVTVGPFTFSVGAGVTDHRNAWTSPTQLTADQRAWLDQQLKPHIVAFQGSNEQGDSYKIISTWFPELQKSSDPWWNIDSDYKSPDGTTPAVNPIAGPVTGTDGAQYWIYIKVCGVNCARGGVGQPDTPYLELTALPVAHGSSTAWSNSLSAIGGFLGSVASAIGGIACDVLGHPAASTAAAAATGGAAGTGVKLAGAICQSNAPVPLVGPATSFGSDLEMMLVVGGGIGLIYLLTRRHKKSASQRRSTKR